MTDRTHRVMYYVGDTLTLRTKALEAQASLTQDALKLAAHHQRE